MRRDRCERVRDHGGDRGQGREVIGGSIEDEVLAAFGALQAPHVDDDQVAASALRVLELDEDVADLGDAKVDQNVLDLGERLAGRTADRVIQEAFPARIG